MSKDFYKILILPILNILLVITVSSFGQFFGFGIGLSFIVSLIFFIIYIYNFSKIPIKINFIYCMLIIFSFIMTLSKNNLEYWCITILSVSAFSIPMRIELSQEQWKKSFLLTAISSLVCLFLYNEKMILTRWNPNSIAIFFTLGLATFFLAFKLEKNRKRILILLLIIISMIEISFTDSRNCLIIYITALITTTLLYKTLLKEVIYKIYSFIILILPMIVVKSVTYIKNAEWINNFLDISKTFFGKGTLLSDRDIFWKICEQYIGNNWIWGTGESLYQYIYSHNMFYAIVYYIGIIGFFLYVYFIYSILMYVYKYGKEDVVAMVCSLIFLAISIGQVMENFLFASDTAIFLPYVFIGIALKRANQMKKEKEREKDEIKKNKNLDKYNS